MRNQSQSVAINCNQGCVPMADAEWLKKHTTGEVTLLGGVDAHMPAPRAVNIREHVVQRPWVLVLGLELLEE